MFINAYLGCFNNESLISESPINVPITKWSSMDYIQSEKQIEDDCMM